jgi:small subunit ribosomal protein S1
LAGGGEVLPHVYRVTKYDPADRDERGSYVGPEPTVSDHGPVEAAYLQAVAAFAEDTGVTQLAIREPQLASPVGFGIEPAVESHGLAGLFPSDLTGFHDGARVSLDLALELVRAMLRDNGVWCRLEAEDVFTVHVGHDQYVYVGSARPCTSAVARTTSLGLFPERLDASPYDFEPDDPSHVQRPADADFWDRLWWIAAAHRATFLEETYAYNASRWHRVTRDNIEEVRSRLAPRALLAVWPDLLTDVDSAIASLPEEGLVEVVREEENGRIATVVVDETESEAVTSWISDGLAAAVVPLYVDARQPLCTAVLPDADGVLRARRQTEPTPGDRQWAFLRTLRKGQLVTGTVTDIASFGVTFVDIGGVTAMINLPELSSRPFDHPSDIVSVGEEITAEVLEVDMVRERVALSLRAGQEDPWLLLAQQIGRLVTGPVTKILPFGVFVRVENREDGFEGLVHTSELDEASRGAVQVGYALTVRIIDVDLTRRRIVLSQTQVSTAGTVGIEGDL